MLDLCSGAPCGPLRGRSWLPVILLLAFWDKWSRILYAWRSFLHLCHDDARIGTPERAISEPHCVDVGDGCQDVEVTITDGAIPASLSWLEGVKSALFLPATKIREPVIGSSNGSYFRVTNSNASTGEGLTFFH
jgi:hypothetical protein